MREHDCTNYIAVRFAGPDDFEGETYCAVCRKVYTQDELRELHAAIYAEAMGERNAA